MEEDVSTAGSRGVNWKRGIQARWKPEKHEIRSFVRIIFLVIGKAEDWKPAFSMKAADFSL